MAYIFLPISRDPAEAVQDSYAVMQAWYPSWKPDPKGADPMTAFLQACAVLYTDVATLATTAADEIFRYEGRTLDNLPPLEARAASGTVTFTAGDTTGWRIPAGLQLAGTGATGEPVVFTTTDEAVIPTGSTAVAGAPVIAALEGEFGNGVTGAGDFVQFLDFLVSVVFDAPTSGGQDAEMTQAYLERLVTLKQLDSPEPIVPSDFATLGQSLAGANVRATAIDGLDPTASPGAQFDNLATVTVALVDAVTGATVDSGTRAAVANGLMAQREEGFQVFAIDPTINVVDVTVEVIAAPGWVLADVEAQVTVAIQAFLDPRVWGAQEGTGQTLTWINTPVVRLYAMISRILALESVAAITPGSLTMQRHGVGSLAAVDLALSGFAPLPTTVGATLAVTAIPL